MASVEFSFEAEHKGYVVANVCLLIGILWAHLSLRAAFRPAYEA